MVLYVKVFILKILPGLCRSYSDPGPANTQSKPGGNWSAHFFAVAAAAAAVDPADAAARTQEDGIIHQASFALEHLDVGTVWTCITLCAHTIVSSPLT